MANPRQRRKSRSGTGKVKTSKASIKNKHKVIVKGPEVLVENWDRHKTVRQNYAKLGLLPNLNPRQAGGIEPVEAVPFAVRSATAATMADLEALGSGDEEEEEEAQSDDDEEEDEPMASTSTAPAPAAPGTLTKGLGRIVRDENGKVIKIILGGEDGEEIEEEVKERVERDDDEEDDDDESDDEDQDKAGQKPSPWGQPMPDWSTENIEREPEQVLGPRSTGQGIPIFGGVRRSVEAKTDVVRELEHLAASQRKVIRHTSEFEGDWLVSLVAKYGDDIDKMARDRKANVWQKTAGEIKRMIVKAGGFAKLEAKVAQAQTDSA